MNSLFCLCSYHVRFWRVSGNRTAFQGRSSREGQIKRPESCVAHSVSWTMRWLLSRASLADRWRDVCRIRTRVTRAFIRGCGTGWMCRRWRRWLRTREQSTDKAANNIASLQQGPRPWVVILVFRHFGLDTVTSFGSVSQYVFHVTLLHT